MITTSHTGLTCMKRVPSALEDEPMDEAGENAAEEQPLDELGQVLVDAHRESETMKESKKFEKMLEDHRKMLYPDCK